MLRLSSATLPAPARSHRRHPLYSTEPHPLPTCPLCGSRTLVLETRDAEPNAIKRRRSCEVCGFRISTLESISRTAAIEAAATLARTDERRTDPSP